MEYSIYKYSFHNAHNIMRRKDKRIYKHINKINDGRSKDIITQLIDVYGWALEDPRYHQIYQRLLPLEVHHFVNNLPTIFVSSEQLLKGLYYMDYKLDELPELINLHAIYSLPNNVVIDNIKINSFMLAKTSEKEYQKRYNNMINTYFDGDDRISDFVCDEDAPEYSVTTYDEQHKSRYSDCINKEDALLLINDNKYPHDDCDIEILDTHKKDKGRIGISRKDIKVHFRLALCLATYAAVFPQSIEKGLPDNFGITKRNIHFISSNRLYIHDKSEEMQISTEVTHSSKKMHIRRGHFKTLRNKRFKRNQDGSLKIIHVKPCVVGKINPYTEKPITVTDLEA